METQIELTKTAIELARLDNRGNMTRPRLPETIRHKVLSDNKLVVLLQCRKENQKAVHPSLTTKKLKITTEYKITAV